MRKPCDGDIRSCCRNRYSETSGFSCCGSINGPWIRQSQDHERAHSSRHGSIHIAAGLNLVTYRLVVPKSHSSHSIRLGAANVSPTPRTQMQQRCQSERQRCTQAEVRPRLNRSSTQERDRLPGNSFVWSRLDKTLFVSALLSIQLAAPEHWRRWVCGVLER